jgi:Spy/CpxP family protein refolding chaperone
MRRLGCGWRVRALPVICVALVLAAGHPLPAFQGPPRDAQRDSGSGGGPPPPMQPNHGPMDRAMHVGPPGKWWSDPQFAQRLGLTADQQKRMEAIFQQNRLKLIDFSAALQKQEAILEPLLATDRPDEATVLAQIDRIAQARANLEKANARMLLGLRGVLTQSQWNQLQAEAPPRRDGPPRR